MIIADEEDDDASDDASHRGLFSVSRAQAATSLDTSIGRAAKFHRVLAKLSERETAERLNISLDLYNAFERGEARLKPDQLLSLADLLRVNVSAFFNPPPVH